MIIRVITVDSSITENWRIRMKARITREDADNDRYLEICSSSKRLSKREFAEITYSGTRKFSSE